MRFWSTKLAAIAAGLTLSFALHAEAPLAPVQDKGFVSPTHEKMAGKVVFAKSNAALTTPEKPDQFVGAAKLSEPIFFRAYLKRSIENAFRAQGVECRRNDVFRRYDALVDGKQIVPADEGFHHERLTAESFEKSTSIRFDEALNGKITPGEASPQAGFLAKIAPAIPVGTHTLKIVVTASCEDKKFKYHALEKPEAEGEITITVDAADAAKVAPALPPAGLKDEKLATEMRSLMKTQWPKDEILKVVITSKAWTVNKHKISGITQSRTIGTAVAVKQGAACKWFDVTFVQPSNGATFGKTQYDSVGNATDIPCASIK